MDDLTVSILTGIGLYFGVGIIMLTALDLATKRIRDRLSSASRDARDKLTASGSLVGAKEATLLTVGALWLFWPLVLFSALLGGKNGKSQ